MPTKISSSRLGRPIHHGARSETRAETEEDFCAGAVGASEDAAAEDLDLLPGVRDRLQERLAAMGVPQRRVVSHVAVLTRRASQSVRRWFDRDRPGLPDLESLARLCIALGCSADGIMGLTRSRPMRTATTPALLAVAQCVDAMAELLTRRGVLGVPMQVPGDEMSPNLREGDIVFVNTAVTQVAGNGIYMLLCEDRMMVRRIEHGVGKSIVLRCDNKAYADRTLKSSAIAMRRGMEIVGKVHGAICARPL